MDSLQTVPDYVGSVYSHCHAVEHQGNASLSQRLHLSDSNALVGTYGSRPLHPRHRLPIHHQSHNEGGYRQSRGEHQDGMILNTETRRYRVFHRVFVLLI